jgi:hypothetical protein
VTDILQEPRFEFLSDDSKAFIHAFDESLNYLGYNFGGQIGDGYCWGRYMLIYRKTGVKSDRVYARLYLRGSGEVVLRMFLNDIDKHRAYIEHAQGYIKEVFTGPHGDCNHCPERTEPCRFRKSYTIDGRLIEKCNGVVFEFHQPSLEKLGGYLALFSEFYSPKKSAR